MKLTVLNVLLLLAAQLFSPIDANSECGTIKGISPTKLIVGSGARDSKPGEWPWLAPLFHYSTYKCGSTLISNKHVITAAQCVVNGSPLDYSVSLGRLSLSSKNEPNSVTKPVVQAYIHEGYNKTAESFKSKDDIAILRLGDPVTFNNFIQKICLPHPNASPINLEGYIVGYGKGKASGSYQDTPKSTVLRSINDHDCIYENPNNTRITSRDGFCAKSDSAAPCDGDTGGGFYVLDRQSFQFSIFGIISHQIDASCNINSYTAFIDLRKYIVWIENKMRDNSVASPGRIRPPVSVCDNCSENSRCVKAKNGSSSCICNAGYVQNGSNKCVAVASDKVNQCDVKPSPCGPNAICEFDSGIIKCKCQANFFGNPPNCIDRCETNYDCERSEVCSKDGRCMKPCDLKPCGQNADCKVQTENIVNCKCTPGFTGNPFTNCYKDTTHTARPGVTAPQNDPCNPSPCGPHSQCNGHTGKALCSCLPNHFGDSPDCRINECDNDAHCSADRVCSNNGRCVRPCDEQRCGLNAQCEPTPGRSYACRCVPGFTGDPYSACSALTITRKPASSWQDPCLNFPCGSNAKCFSNQGVPSCTCLPNYSGDPPNCVSNECKLDSDCRYTQRCSVVGKCVDPCDHNDCGPNTDCIRSYANRFTCKCKNGYYGDPKRGCQSLDSSYAPTPATTYVTDSQCMAEFCKSFQSKCYDRNTVCKCERKKEMDCHCNCDTVNVEFDRSGGSITYKKNFQWFLEW